MTNLEDLESLSFPVECSGSNNTLQTNNNCYKKHQHRHVLKSKENTIKLKCKKALKQKLRKYKLRQDGEEDPEVFDVSKVFVSSLRIKSPREVQSDHSDVEDFEYIRPKNYLFKMVRRKLNVKPSGDVSLSSDGSICNGNKLDSPIISSQERKKTNAFQLLMDSRNKSIGSNSPGKERDDQSDSEEVCERKSIKAKRQLLLLKMAEAKGSLKNKEKEELQDEIIKKKMNKRAENLKQMIMKNADQVLSPNSKKVVTTKNTLSMEAKESIEPSSNKQSKPLKMVDIFNTVEDPIIEKPEKKKMLKEDLEFLQKLSPSLKKKESMLSYFKKVDKEPEAPEIQETSDNVIKVKFKRKKKHKRLSLKKNTTELIEINDENIKTEATIYSGEPITVEDSDKSETVIGERLKRKRKEILVIKDTIIDDIVAVNEGRPKRSVKRPVKYEDNGGLSNSDDDLHIFTPKKKKHTENVINSKQSSNSKLELKEEVAKPDKKISNKSKDTKLPSKPVKLAPIFASKQLDPAALEAKQKFLHSGVPDKLKKIISQQKNIIIDNTFPVVVHVQQENTFPEISNSNLNLPEMSICEDIEETKYEIIFQSLLVLNGNGIVNVELSCKKNTHKMLNHIKELHPRFPVYRTYSYLRGIGKGELKDCNYTNFDNSVEIMYNLDEVMNDYPDRLSWTGKYKAHTSKQIIGNFECIKELRKWLITWTENVMKPKPKANCESDSSEYYQSDTDSRDSMKNLNNLIILTGPPGCGKTSSVYVVASELAMKVIEVNASSRRTGKIMLQDLQEATQSHKVNRGPGSQENSQKSQEKMQESLSKKIKKRGRPKKEIVKENVPKKDPKSNGIVSNSVTSSSQESTRTDSSLILVDDADIVFDQDDGFSSAIMQLVQSSKRPVILITSTLVCPHLQRFLQNGKILKLYPLAPRLLGTWLDIMCLAETGLCWPGVGAKFLNYFNGDIRKTMNYLQFYLSSYAQNNISGEETASQCIDNYKENMDDESSNMAWTDSDDTDRKRLEPCNTEETNIIWSHFTYLNCNLFSLDHPLSLFNIWWSLLSLLNIPQHLQDDVNTKRDSLKEKQDTKELEAIANVVDSISLSDYLVFESNSEYDIGNRPWHCPETDSVSEQENVHYFRKSQEVMNEICHTMVTSSVLAAQCAVGCDRRSEVSSPGMTLQRERDRIVSRHKHLTACMTPSAALDRRGLALDYWPTCRTICRIEKSKNDSNSKRNNRFCHYLKSLSVLCKSDTFDNLCDSLSYKDGTNGFSE